MNISNGLNKKRFFVLIGILLLCAVLLLVVQKTELVYYNLLTAPLPVGSQITNRAQATFQDSGGANYGPVYSNSVSTTIIEVAGATLTIVHNKESITDDSGQVTIQVFAAGTTQLVATITATAGTTGQGTVSSPTALVSGQRYDLVLKVPYYLTKKLTNIQWPPTATLNFGNVLAGNLNDTDNMINSLDWSLMNSRWRTADPVADINRDSLVNVVDWGVLNKNWGMQGE